MASDVKSLTRDWIQYLKNNQIVSMQSDPETGKLKYKKKVTTDILADFLEKKTDFGEEAIANAIHSVLARKATSSNAPGVQDNTDSEESNKDLPSQQTNNQQPDINVPKTSSGSVTEAFADTEGYAVSEEDIESIFNILYSGVNKPDSVDNSKKEQNRKNRDINRFKEMIRYKMSDSQIKALWRALNET